MTDIVIIRREIERMMAQEMALYKESLEDGSSEVSCAPVAYTRLQMLLEFVDSMPSNNEVYVVTRCEEHSDYVEKVFADEKKVQEYCSQFDDKEDEYARQYTKIGITL